MEATRIAIVDGKTCPNCGGSGARLTSQDQVDALLRKFFEHGSTAPAGRWEPIFKLSSAKLDTQSEAVFDRTLRGDCALLVRHSSGSVFRNAPNTWRLGYTAIAEDLDTAIAAASDPACDESVSRLLDRLIDHSVTSVIPTGRLIYRLRRDLGHPFEQSQFDAAPVALTERSRFADGSQPVFYGAFDVETCLHECRVLTEHSLTLATLLTTRELRVVDLTDVPYDTGSAGTDGGDLFYLISARILFGSRSRVSQLFGSRVRERGFNGIVYPSFLSNVRLDHERHSNIALFGTPLREGTISLHSLNRVRLDTVRYDFSFGPVTQAPSKDDLAEFQRLVSELESDQDPKHIAQRIREIASRADPKD